MIESPQLSDPEKLVVDAHARAVYDINRYLQQRHPHGEKSFYWSIEAETIAYIYEATPKLLSRLRDHCLWITGVLSYQYAAHHYGSASMDNLLNRLAELERRKPDLEVFPERQVLGGFGFPRNGKLYNVDTLKYHEVVIGLKEQREINQLTAPVFCEIGSGFGGLADTLLNQFSNSKVILIDLPEVMIFAYTFLQVWRSDLKIVFQTSGVLDESADVVLIPYEEKESISIPSGYINCLVNTVSFQEMTTKQVEDYLDWSSKLKIPYLYSLNRDVSNYNVEISSVSQILGSRYAIKLLQILDTEYTSALKNTKKVKLHKPKVVSNPYKHLFGKLKSI